MADRVDTGGLTTALKLLGAAGAVAGADGQSDLFEAEAPLPLPPSASAPARQPGQAGRPAGTRNRSTEEWVRFFLSQNRSPLSVLGSMISRPTEELVDELQAMADKHAEVKARRAGEGSETTFNVYAARINPLEVLRLQATIATALLPYIHRKQPQAIEVEQKQRGIVLIGDLEVSDITAGDDLALPLPPIEEKQGVNEAAATPVGQTQVGQAGLHSLFNGVGDDDI